jgi:beta-phosphoglucomutase-like phosphatase (HAD superfamily)
MARAFCFDLDGTLMDSEVIWVRVVEGFMRGEDSTVSHEEVLRIVYGKSWHDVYTGIHERLRGLKMTFATVLPPVAPLRLPGPFCF